MYLTSGATGLRSGSDGTGTDTTGSMMTSTGVPMSARRGQANSVDGSPTQSDRIRAERADPSQQRRAIRIRQGRGQPGVNGLEQAGGGDGPLVALAVGVVEDDQPAVGEVRDRRGQAG